VPDTFCAQGGVAIRAAASAMSSVGLVGAVERTAAQALKADSLSAVMRATSAETAAGAGDAD